MKKLMFLPLVAGLMVALSLAVVATEDCVRSLPSETTIPVTGIYSDGTKYDVVYSVDISWGNMEFTYSNTPKKTWNPATHTYDAVEGNDGWSCAPATETTLAGNQIKITNHSNADVNCTANFTPVENVGSIDNFGASFSEANFTLHSAEGVQISDSELISKELTKTISLTLSGSLPEGFNGEVGTVTLSFRNNS